MPWIQTPQVIQGTKGCVTSLRRHRHRLDTPGCRRAKQENGGFHPQIPWDFQQPKQQKSDFRVDFKDT